MFNWSTTRASPSRKNGSPSYPANRSSNATTSSSTPLRVSITREQHLYSYLNHPILKPSTRPVIAQMDTTYDTVFKTKSYHALILRVHLPADNTVPQMSLVGILCTDSFVAPDGRVIGFDFTTENQWKVCGKTLGEMVYLVVKHFQLNPPENIVITDTCLQKIQTVPPSSAKALTHTTPDETVPLHYSKCILETMTVSPSELTFTIPEVPTSFPQFQRSCITDQQTHVTLAQLLTNDDQLSQWIVDHRPELQALKDTKSNMIQSNVQAAKHNLATHQQWSELTDEVKALQSTLNSKVQTFHTLQTKLRKLCSDSDPDVQTVMKKMEILKRQSYDESEELASNWIEDGEGMTSGEFIKAYLEKRIVHHTRAAKLERMSVM